MAKTYSRKATFVATQTKQGRAYRAVNKPAKTVVRRLMGLSNHKRKNYPTLTLAQIRATKGKGTYKFYQYVGTELKAIR